MSDSTISNLPLAASVNATDVIPIDTGTPPTTKKTTLAAAVAAALPVIGPASFSSLRVAGQADLGTNPGIGDTPVVRVVSSLTSRSWLQLEPVSGSGMTLQAKGLLSSDSVGLTFLTSGAGSADFGNAVGNFSFRVKGLIPGPNGYATVNPGSPNVTFAAESTSLTDVGMQIRSQGAGQILLQSSGTKITVSNTGLGFNGNAAMAKPAITGSRGGNAALASLLTALAAYGLITDSTTA